MITTIVSIPGIHCDACIALIKDVSSDFPSIEKVDIDSETKKVTLTHTEDFDLELWKKEIEALDPKYIVFSV